MFSGFHQIQFPQTPLLSAPSARFDHKQGASFCSFALGPRKSLGGPVSSSKNFSVKRHNEKSKSKYFLSTGGS